MAKKKNLKKTNSFSKLELAMFIFIFAAVGAIALIVSFAAPHSGGGGGKPSGGSSTISLVLPPDVDNNGDGLPNHGDSVSFNVSTTATSQPFVNLLCSQNGVNVENSWLGYFVGSLDYPNKKFVLGSGAWTSGAADCTASIVYYTSNGKTVTAASTSFHVNA